MTAATYDYESRAFGVQPVSMDDYRFRRCLAQLGQGENRVLLDVGCGAGNRTVLSDRATPGLTCIGLEYTEQSIRAGLAGDHGDVVFLRGSVEDIPLADASIDYVTGFDIFEHLTRPEAALRECLRVLKPGGMLHAFIPCEGEPLTVYQWAPPVRWLKRDNVGHIQHFRKARLRVLLRDLGAEIIDEQHSYFYISQLGDAVRQLSKLIKTEATQTGIPAHRIKSKPLAALVKAYRLDRRCHV